ncbi:MAG TPA: M28 family peptidase, partial [Vicinamibacteria bacterium]
APRRTILFAAVAGEEQGLLGSAYLGAHPPVPIGLIAANINIDELGIWGKTRDMIMIGKGKSTLDTVVEAIAAAQGRRHIVGDQNPDKGFFYRSDQFALAKVGVPAAYFDEGIDVIGKPAGWGKEQKDKYEEKDYHQPSDELRPDWDFSGAVEDAQLYFYLGLKVANANDMPTWKPGDEFEGARKKALAAAK